MLVSVVKLEHEKYVQKFLPSDDSKHEFGPENMSWITKYNELVSGKQKNYMFFVLKS